MKKLCTLLAIALFTSNLLSAQEGQHEISIGYGVGTSAETADLFEDIVVGTFTGGRYRKEEDHSGAFHLAYKYLVSEKIGVGGTLLYESSKGNIHENEQKVARLKRHFYTLAAEADYRYIRKPNFTLYSALGVGYTHMNEKITPESGGEEKDSDGSINFQVTALGAKFGSNIGGFIEAGFGYKGIGSIGAFARF